MDNVWNGTQWDDTIYSSWWPYYNVVYANDGNDHVYGSYQNDYLRGGNGNDDVRGDGGDDSLFGDDGNDLLYGGDGNDYLDGGSGADAMYGESGDDTYIVDNSNDVVGESVNNGTDTVLAYVSYTLPANVENLSLLGNDTTYMYGIGNDLANGIQGNNASNYLSGNGGDDVIRGGGGDDYLMGGSGKNILDGGTGNDMAIAYTGGYAYVSDNSLTVYDANWNVVESDTLLNIEQVTLASDGSGGNQILCAWGYTKGSVSLYGGPGNDGLYGGLGNDTLAGGLGNDYMMGGSGDDRYFVDSPGDAVVEYPGEGTDSVYSFINYTLPTNVENLTVTGVDLIGNGNELNNQISGGAGNDTLNGGAGDDTLNGGGGTNILIGGDGKDTFQLDKTFSNSLQIIQDFQRGTDHIDVQGASASSIAFGFQNGTTNVYIGNQLRAQVTGWVDTTDLINESGTTFNPPTIVAQDLNNIPTIVNDWAKAYAASIGDSLNSNVQIPQSDFTLGAPVYTSNAAAVTIDSLQTASMTFRNNSTADQSTTFTFGSENNLEYANTTTKDWRIGGSVTGTIGSEVEASLFGTGGKTSASLSITVSGEYGQSVSDQVTQGQTKMNQTSTTFNTPANSVTTANVTISGRTFESDYNLPVNISGNVHVDLTNGQDFDIPINAILQHYNPTLFQSQDPAKTTFYQLGNTYMVYNPTTTAIVKGHIKEAILLDAHASTDSVYDREVSGNSPDAFNLIGTLNKERFWLGRGALPATTRPIQIQSFGLQDDQVAISVPGINGYTLRSNFTPGSYPTNVLLLDNHTETTPDGFTQTVGDIFLASGSGATQTIRTLAELPGVDVNTLGASNFKFNTMGTLFDSSLNAAGSNYSQQVPILPK
jgi:Ca2+-binding RTX toxin-like protein